METGTWDRDLDPKGYTYVLHSAGPGSLGKKAIHQSVILLAQEGQLSRWKARGIPTPTTFENVHSVDPSPHSTIYFIYHSHFYSFYHRKKTVWAIQACNRKKRGGLPFILQRLQQQTMYDWGGEWNGTWVSRILKKEGKRWQWKGYTQSKR